MKNSRKYYVYIVTCSDESYYVGVTNDYLRRVKEHNDGINQECYTYFRRPVQLKGVFEFDSIYKAIEFEKQVKGWSRKKKEALISGNLNELKYYSKRKSCREKE